jgi:hypothetical protein
MRVRTVIKLGALAGAIGWLHSIGALDPKLWADTIRRERERLPGQFHEALEAGRREAARAEERLERDIDEAFRSGRP